MILNITPIICNLELLFIILQVSNLHLDPFSLRLYFHIEYLGYSIRMKLIVFKKSN